jgi:hypothetical protein
VRANTLSLAPLREDDGIITPTDHSEVRGRPWTESLENSDPRIWQRCDPKETAVPSWLLGQFSGQRGFGVIGSTGRFLAGQTSRGHLVRWPCLWTAAFGTVVLAAELCLRRTPNSGGTRLREIAAATGAFLPSYGSKGGLSCASRSADCSGRLPSRGSPWLCVTASTRSRVAQTSRLRISADATRAFLTNPLANALLRRVKSGCARSIVPYKRL